MHVPRQINTNHMASSNNCQSPLVHGNPSLWISLSNFQHQRDTTILVIVDCLTKQSLFIPTHDSISSLELAQLFLTHIFSKHGMPPMSPPTGFQVCLPLLLIP